MTQAGQFRENENAAQLIGLGYTAFVASVEATMLGKIMRQWEAPNDLTFKWGKKLSRLCI
ncbi:MAG: hypothetical protein RL693_1937 [Verrucomicrobiota bacterium]